VYYELCWSFIGPDYRIGSNFWKFYLIRIGFTLGELVSLVKVFRLFRLERIFFGVQRCTMICLVVNSLIGIEFTSATICETTSELLSKYVEIIFFSIFLNGGLLIRPLKIKPLKPFTTFLKGTQSCSLKEHKHFFKNMVSYGTQPFPVRGDRIKS